MTKGERDQYFRGSPLSFKKVLVLEKLLSHHEKAKSFVVFRQTSAAHDQWLIYVNEESSSSSILINQSSSSPAYSIA